MSKTKTKPRKKKATEAVEEPRRFKHFGRPSKYSEELALEICCKLCEGVSLQRICADEGMPSQRTVYTWLLDPKLKDFLQMYSESREIQAHVYAEQTIDIADNDSKDIRIDDDGQIQVNYENINRSKARILARQWYSAKLHPRKYGDRQAVEMSGPDGAAVSPVHIYLPDKGRKK